MSCTANSHTTDLLTIPALTFQDLERRFEGVDFHKLDFTPRMRKEEFVQALWRLSDFKARYFSFDRLCEKIIALLNQDGDSERIMGFVHFWIYCAVLECAGPGKKIVDGDVLGTAGEISGIYETIFRRHTTLSGIKLGRFANIQLAVFDEGDVPVKVFDAVSVDETKEIVTVFEFKFTLALRKLYQQVIGMDSAKLPHLAVLRKHPEYRHTRNLVYFGEVGDEHLTEAVARHLSARPGLAQRVRLTDRGFALKMSLPEVSDFLCDPGTLALAQKLGKPFLAEEASSPEYGSDVARIRSSLAETQKCMRARGNSKFDVIIAVSNVPLQELTRIKSSIGRAG